MHPHQSATTESDLDTLREIWEEDELEKYLSSISEGDANPISCRVRILKTKSPDEMESLDPRKDWRLLRETLAEGQAVGYCIESIGAKIPCEIYWHGHRYACEAPSFVEGCHELEGPAFDVGAYTSRIRRFGYFVVLPKNGPLPEVGQTYNASIYWRRTHMIGLGTQGVGEVFIFIHHE